MRILSLTDIGVSRKDNQDNYWAARLDVNNKEYGVLCLCDGMGGLNNGGLASKMVVETVRNYCLQDLDLHGLIQEISKCNLEIYNLGKNSNKLLGTTCTVLISDSDSYRIAHIGDSRCYFYDGTGTKAVTVDHSALQKYGVTMQNNPVLFKKYKNSLTRCIGVKPKIQMDTYKGKCSKGNKFLVCSDGFWHYFKENKLQEISSVSMLNNLVNSYMSMGETDNITVGVLEV